MSNELVASWFGDFSPFPFSSDGVGSLNSEGGAFASLGSITLNSSNIGRVLYFCAVAGPPGGRPQISSASVSLEIVP